MRRKMALKRLTVISVILLGLTLALGNFCHAEDWPAAISDVKITKEGIIYWSCPKGNSIGFTSAAKYTDNENKVLDGPPKSGESKSTNNASGSASEVPQPLELTIEEPIPSFERMVVKLLEEPNESSKPNNSPKVGWAPPDPKDSKVQKVATHEGNPGGKILKYNKQPRIVVLPDVANDKSVKNNEHSKITKIFADTKPTLAKVRYKNKDRVPNESSQMHGAHQGACHKDNGNRGNPNPGRHPGRQQGKGKGHGGARGSN